MSKPKDVIKQIKKETRRQFSAEEKIRIVLEGLRGETPISEICRREGIASSVYCKWSIGFLEVGKNGLTIDTLWDRPAMKSRSCGRRTTSSNNCWLTRSWTFRGIKEVSARKRQRYRRMSRSEKMKFIRVIKGTDYGHTLHDR